MKKVRDGYKMTELGDIPNEWRISALGNICEFKGRIGWRGYTKNDLREYGPLVIGATQISASNKLDFSNPTYLSTEKYEESPEIKVYLNDIILVKTGNTIGKVAIVDKEIGDATINPNTVLLKNITCFNKYLYYIVVSEIIQKPLNKSITVGAQPSVNQETLKKILIPIPTSKEQEKIASILSTVDEQIDNVDALIEKNKELKKGLMQTLLTKGIGHTKFKKTEIGEVPSEWYIKSIDEITKEVYRYPTYYGIEYVEEGIAEIRGELLNDDASIKKECFRYISEKTAKKFPRTKLEVGDIVISVRGTIGKVGYITEELAGSNITANLLRVSMNRNIMNEHFIKQLFLSDIMKRKFDEITTATTIKTFKVPEFKQIILAIPTKDEQDKIASILLEVDKKIEEHENKKQKLENLKKGLMQQLLTGKIRTI